MRLPALAAVLLLHLAPVRAQDENVACPCFSYEEAEAVFLRAQQLTEQEGQATCLAQDYSVEFSAELSIMDPDYTTTAQARVAWYDFDPSSCAYSDPTANPGVERVVRTPHPAPEAPARACFDVILSLIEKSDAAGRCSAYP